MYSGVLILGHSIIIILTVTLAYVSFICGSAGAPTCPTHLEARTLTYGILFADLILIVKTIGYFRRYWRSIGWFIKIILILLTGTTIFFFLVLAFSVILGLFEKIFPFL